MVAVGTRCVLEGVGVSPFGEVVEGRAEKQRIAIERER